MIASIVRSDREQAVPRVAAFCFGDEAKIRDAICLSDGADDVPTGSGEVCCR